jgi:hypothetical protein
MSGIEERYRFVLRLLPASYRQRWEEDMVAAFLESVTPEDPEEAEFVQDYGRPSWPEVASVVALALRLRLAHAGAPPRYLAWAQAVRLAALGWVFLSAVAGATSLGIHLWLVGAVPGLPAPMNGEFLPLRSDHWVTAVVVIGLLWVPAYVALLLADRRVGRALVLLAVVAESALLLAGTGRRDPVGGTLFVLLAADALLALSLTAFHRHAPRVPPRPWLLALPVGVVLATGLLVSAMPTRSWWADWPAHCSVVVVVASILHLCVPRFRRLAPWTLALAILTLAVLMLRVVSLRDYRGLVDPAFVTFGLVETGALVAVGVPLVLLAARALRRLPAKPADIAAWSTSSDRPA